MPSQLQNTIIQYRQHAIRLYQTSADSTFRAGVYYIAAPIQEDNQIQNLLMKATGIVRTTEHTTQYAEHLLQRAFVQYFSRTL